MKNNMVNEFGINPGAQFGERRAARPLDAKAKDKRAASMLKRVDAGGDGGRFRDVAPKELSSALEAGLEESIDEAAEGEINEANFEEGNQEAWREYLLKADLMTADGVITAADKKKIHSELGLAEGWLNMVQKRQSMRSEDEKAEDYELIDTGKAERVA